MAKDLKEQILFILDDDNEIMAAATADPDSDLDEENKRLNRELIARHDEIIAKVERGETLSDEDLVLIADANEIHLNDTINAAGHHEAAVNLDEWLGRHRGFPVEEAISILKAHLDRNPGAPAEVYQALHALWKAATVPAGSR